MTTTEHDARALAYLAQRLREETHGANTWDQNGIWAECRKLVGTNLAIACEIVTRHAADPTAKTPGAFRRPFVPEAQGPQPWRPPKASEACPVHGGWAGNCSGCGSDRLAGTTTPKRTTSGPLDPRGFEIVRDAIAAERHKAATARESHKKAPGSDEQATSGVQSHHDHERTAE